MRGVYKQDVNRRSQNRPDQIYLVILSKYVTKAPIRSASNVFWLSKPKYVQKTLPKHQSIIK